jgi:transposase
MKNHITIGMDLGDRNHIVVVMDGDGREIECTKVTNTKVSVERFFSKVLRSNGGH